MKKLLLALPLVTMIGCANMSPDYESQSLALKEYHKAVVVQGLAEKNYINLTEAQNQARQVAKDAAIRVEATKAELDSLLK